MFGAITKLKALLTQQNLMYLDVILSMLVRGEDPEYREIYTKFWAEFSKHFSPDQGHANSAWKGLRQLLAIVQEQLDGK